MSDPKIIRGRSTADQVAALRRQEAREAAAATAEAEMHRLRQDEAQRAAEAATTPRKKRKWVRRQPVEPRAYRPPSAAQGRTFLKADARDVARDNAVEADALRMLWTLKVRMHDADADLPFLAAEWLAQLEALRGARFRLGLEAAQEQDPIMPPVLRAAVPDRMADTASALI